jgi:hypothetical protein
VFASRWTPALLYLAFSQCFCLELQAEGIVLCRELTEISTSFALARSRALKAAGHRQSRKSAAAGLQAHSVYQFKTTLCPAVTVAGRLLLPSLTEYFPAGTETGWLTCLDTSCVPEASSTA